MTENSAYIEYLRTQFEMIRDERRTSANTATRIGTAFLDLLGLVELHDDTPWETIEDPETGEKSAHLREGYDGAWTEGYLSALGRGNEDDEGSALLFDPLASINEANLGMPMEAGVGIVWNGLRWEYGKTGGGGFSSISQDGLSLTFSGDGLQSQTISLSHTHNVSDLTNDLGFVTSDTLSVLLAEKVDVTWFSRLFKAYNGSTEVTPNQNGTIDNIKAMFGFWTEQYLSALGRGSNASSMLDETMMWALLGSSGNQQIDISHLQSALGTFMPQGVLISVARGSADGKIDFVGSGPGNVYTVDFIHTHAFSDITGRPTTLAGYGITDAYTMTQTDALLATKVDVSWFRTLFKAYSSNGTEITPNATGTIDNIQAMVGFWTNQYISALGRGSTGSTMLDEALMWSILANSDTTKQISLSHLTTALSSYAQTTNVITSVSKNSTDGKINFISQAQTYTVDFIHTHAFTDITGKPTTLAGYGITDAAAKIHTHDIYLGTTKLTTGNAAGSVSSITGMSSVNTDALVLRQITYNSQTVNAVGIGMTPSYPLDVAKRARFADGLYLYESNANLRIGASRLLFSGSGIADSYIRKGSSYLALSSSSSGENGLVVYNTNEVRFTAGAWSDGYLSALGQNSSSDQRLKTELGKVDLKLGNIANAPMVRYFWTAKPWLGDQAGSYAQYWQTILPETVKEGRDGYLEMQYGVIALLSVIATARCVEDHERRIKVLEEENKQLKKQLKSYGYAI